MCLNCGYRLWPLNRKGASVQLLVLQKTKRRYSGYIKDFGPFDFPCWLICFLEINFAFVEEENPQRSRVCCEEFLTVQWAIGFFSCGDVTTPVSPLVGFVSFPLSIFFKSSNCWFWSDWNARVPIYVRSSTSLNDYRLSGRRQEAIWPLEEARSDGLPYVRDSSSVNHLRLKLPVSSFSE